MRFKTRLIVANVLFAVGLLSSVAIMFVYSSRQSDYEQLVLQAHRLKTAMHETNSMLKSTLFGDHLATSYENFQTSYAQFSSQVRELIEHPFYQRVVSSVKYGQTDTESLENVMAMNRDKISNIDALVAELTEGKNVYLPGPMKAKTQLDLFTGKEEEIKRTSDEIERAVRYFGSAMETNIDQIITDIENAAAKNLRQLRLLSLSLSGAVLAVVVIFSFLIIRLLRRKLTTLHNSLRILSSGDFSHRLQVSGKDELSDLGRTVNEFIEEFCTIIRDAKNLSRESTVLKNKLAESADHSAAATKQMKDNVMSITGRIEDLVRNIENSQMATGSISEKISDLNSRIETQSSSVTQSSSSVEEMAASIENVSSISSKRKEAAEELSRIAAETGEKMSETNTLIEENAGDTENILEVINIINNVASQTNRLSMNAAIEAAHAGDAGRGFAVVAEEIRSLAETTNSNSKKIRTTVNTIADRISRITEMSRETQEAFQRINEETNRSSESMAEISSSMEELTQGSREIMEAMTSLSHITQEIQESSEEMQGHTRQVNDSVEKIQVIGEEVNNGIREIGHGATEVDTSMHRIHEINNKSSTSIEHLQETVSKFKTESTLDEDDTTEEHSQKSPEGKDPEGEQEAELEELPD